MPLITVANGTTLCYETFGPSSGRPLVLIEGLTAQMIKWRVELCQLLVDAGFYVVRFDNRDVGLSQKFDRQLYTLSDMAEDTAGLIGALGIAPVHLVGQSMGGMIAQIVAAQHPDLIASLGLIYTTASSRFLRPVASDREILADHSTLDRDAAIEEFLAGEYFCRSEAYPQDLPFLRGLAGQSYDRDPIKSGNARQAEAVFTAVDRTELVARISAPTVILTGDADQLIDHQASVELHELIPGSTLHVFPGMGHEVPQLLWKDIANAVLRNAARTTAVH